jgi:hypothetical protein
MVKKLENNHNRTPGREVKAGNLEYEARMLRVSSKKSILFLISLPLISVPDIAPLLSVLSSLYYNICGLH